MNEVTYNLDDFIGVFDGYFGDSLCDNYVDHFKMLEDRGFVVPREEKHRHEVSDKSVSLLRTSFEGSSVPANYILKDFGDIFWSQCANVYSKEYSILRKMAYHTIVDAKIQKSIEGDGYHVWHCEDEGGRDVHRNRLLVFSLYLNDDYDGGETEFLFQKKRMKPQKDRLLIWPAQFTHTHRGNTVLKGNKYLLTGWVEFSNQWIDV